MDRPYQIDDQNAVHFLTITVIDWMDVFTRKEYKLEIVDSLNYCVEKKGLDIYAWCLMSNHLHLLCRAKEPHRLSDIMRDFKKFTAMNIIKSMEKESVESRKKWMLNQMEFRANNINRIAKYKFWKDGLHAIFIDSTKFFEQKFHYIHQNPVEAMIVEEEEHYLFSSARDYTGVKGLVKVSLY